MFESEVMELSFFHLLHWKPCIREITTEEKNKDDIVYFLAMDNIHWIQEVHTENEYENDTVHLHICLIYIHMPPGWCRFLENFDHLLVLSVPFYIDNFDFESNFVKLLWDWKELQSCFCWYLYRFPNILYLVNYISRCLMFFLGELKTPPKCYENYQKHLTIPIQTMTAASKLF